MSITVIRKLVSAGFQPPPPSPPAAPSGALYPSTYSVPNYQELAFGDVQIGTDAVPGTMPANGGTTSPGRYCDWLVWNNIGGDWKDLNGAAQGTTPFDSNTPAVTTWAHFNNANMLAKVRAWIAGGKNYGFFLRKTGGTGSVNFNTRFAGANLPLLVLTHSTLGTINVACARSQWMTPASVSAAPLAGVVGNGGLILWFDLSPYFELVPTAVTAVDLQVYSPSQSGGGCTVGVFELWNPGDQGTMPDQEAGVAAGYNYDVGLINDDSILFHELFQDSSYASRFGSYTIDSGQPDSNERVTVADSYGFSPLLDRYAAIRVYVKAGTHSISQFSASWSPWRTGGLHVKPRAHRDELFARYYLMLGTDWRPEPEGGKMPGWDGRFTGIAGMGNGNGGTGCTGYEGYSVRGAFLEGTGYTDATHNDPLYNGAWLDYGDVYNIDQPGNIADGGKAYGTVAGWGRNYLGWLRRGQWYCVEQYLKLNTVTERPTQSITSLTAGPLYYDGSTPVCQITATLAAPDTLMQVGDYKFISGALPITFCADSPDPPYSTSGFGNSNHVAVRITSVPDSTHFTYVINTSVQLPTNATGTITAEHNIPNADGITRVWINGRLAHEKTNWRFRASYKCRDGVTPFSIDAWWGNVYQGGTATVINDGHLYIAALAIGTRYIGPMKAEPEWLASQASNTWIEIKGATWDTKLSSMGDDGSAAWDAFNVIRTGYDDTGHATGGGLANGGGIMNYSGGALKNEGSEMLVFGGGGAAAWAGNDVRGLRLEDDQPTWHVRKAAGALLNVWPSSGTGVPHNYMRDGATPNSQHSYDHPQYIDAVSKFMVMGTRQPWEKDESPWPQAVNGCALDGTAVWDAPGTYPNSPWGQYDSVSFVIKHPTTEMIYVGGADRIWQYSYLTKQFTIFTQRNSPTPPTNATFPSTGYAQRIAGIDTKRNKLLAFAVNGGTLDLTTRVYTPFTPATNFGGAAASELLAFLSTHNKTSGVPNMVYDPLLDCYLVFIDNGKLYKITYNSDTNYDVVDLGVSVPAGGQAPTANGSAPHTSATLPLCMIYGRFQYVPNLRGVCVIQAYNQNAFFVKTA